MNVQRRPLPPAGWEPDDYTLSPAQRQPIDWSEPEPAPLPVRRVTYVPAASDIIQMPSVPLASPDANIAANVTPFATVEAKTLGSHHDRARAWTRYAMPLCGGVAAVAVLAAWTLADVPILSFWSLLVFGLAFILAYVLLLLRYWRHTPEGVALDSSRQLWGFLRAEQTHRHTIERSAWDMQRRRIEERNGRNG